ncbi:MAG: hypothetical protein V3T15_09235 [Pseudomonadales bacterium]
MDYGGAAFRDPQEVDDVLVLHPKVMDVAVIGVPDEEMGEAVKAVVQPAARVDVGPELEQQLLAYAREHVAHFKCPKSVDFEDELPRLPTGKLYKRLQRSILRKERFAHCNENTMVPGTIVWSWT